MSTIDALILGIIQGLTEFLPVSSSGHIELGKALLDIHIKENLLVSIVLHAATALSTIIVYRKDILDLLKDIFTFQWNESTAFALKIIISMLPVGIAGVFFKDQIESFFEGRVMLVGSMLLITGVLLLLTTFLEKKQGKEVGFGQSLIIGLAQAIAILPGISRSGATISTSLMIGVSREKAARFSFLMVLPPIIGATLLQVKDYMETPVASGQVSSFILAIGFIAAFITGLLACTLMIRLVKQGKLAYFAVYCFIVGVSAIIASL
ncbi:undecaprenyl-diphosphate phosphatase [Rapidithrix thailandica]|uniref:Undecaprenyl-diphosphatase n=1 Tax=Rapidithrix thailandica TaxID=413964 RepID=A0AAW9S5B6_9BACT